MSRRLTALSLFALGVFALGTAAQPPGESKSVYGPTKTTIAFLSKMVTQPAAKKADAPDTAIEAALSHDPDIRMARAKIQLAEAELSKARQVVTQKVLTLQSAIREQKKAVVTAEESFALVNAGFTKGQVARAELLTVRDRLETVQAALARSETELKLATGDDGKSAASTRTGVAEALVLSDAKHYATFLAAHAKYAKVASGPIPERIRAALDKPIKLGAKDEKVTFDKALEAFKKVGMDVPVRVNLTMLPIDALDQELPVGAWLQVFADGNPECMMLVREYGLLVTAKSLSPPTDAPSVFDFWKQKPAAADTPKK